MTRRLVVTIVATVGATLLVAGLITLAIARARAVQTTEDDLRVEAEALVATVVALDDASASDRPLVRAVDRRVVRAVRQALRVDGAELVLVGPAGGITGSLPAGLSPDDLDVEALVAGETTSGANGSLVYAAAPTEQRTTVVAVVTREASPGLASAARWFAIAALVTLVVGAVVALLLGRRLARPVRDASATARRIADGELSARLPDPGDDARPADELADLARAVNTMAESLEQSKAAERQFFLSVSHDLRTPLTSIRGYAEAIADGAAPDVRVAAEVIESQAQRLERLVGDLLDLARLDAHAFTLHIADVDLRAAARDAVAAAYPDAERADVTVGLHADSTPVVVRADATRVQQIMANLLDNAARYARSRIDVQVVASAREGVLIVDDDGPGIPPDQQAHVFDRLYTTRRAGGTGVADAGSGLGLAIVRQLAIEMGGSAGAGEAPDGGARLEVRLPLAAVAADDTVHADR